jgi:hypothetical protein
MPVHQPKKLVMSAREDASIGNIVGMLWLLA